VVHRYSEIVDLLSESTNPIIRYKSSLNLQGADPNDSRMRALREEIKDSPIAQGLLADLAMSDASTRSGRSTIYDTFKYLADIDYPAGDESLLPFRDVVYGWLRRLEKDYDGPLYIRDKYRVHGSFHGNAIYASVVLGIANDETDELCGNLLRYQWPNGGWNCSKIPKAKGPTIVHTAYGMRGLVTYRPVKDSPEIRRAIDDCAEILLERQLYLKRTNGKPLRPVYTKTAYPYPRLYNFMAGLHILTRSGHITDPRCDAALDLLESKYIEGQGWEMERKLFHHNENKEDFTNVHWEKEKLGKANQFLTVDALEILRESGRFQ
jgi:hypothetical protein